MEKCLKWNSAWTQINTLTLQTHSHTNFPGCTQNKWQPSFRLLLFAFLLPLFRRSFPFSPVCFRRKNDIHHVHSQELPSAFRYLPPLPLSFLLDGMKTKWGEHKRNFNYLCHALIVLQTQQRAVRWKDERKHRQNDRIVNSNHSLDGMSEEKKIVVDRHLRTRSFPFCCLITDVYDKYAPFLSRSYFISYFIADCMWRCN